MKLGSFSFDPKNGTILNSDGSEVFLKPKARALLCVLAAADGRIVTKEELLDTVWPKVTVSEDSLYQAVSEARRALRDKSGAIVATVPSQGYRLISSPASFPPKRYVWFAVCLALILSVGMVASWRKAVGPASGFRNPSIAVLPFDALSGAEVAQRLARGLSAEVTTELARNPWLDVIAFEASETQTGVSPNRAANALQARFLLDGSLGLDEDTLRVSARLSDTATNRVIWAQRWTEEPENFFDLEARILEGISGPLGGALTGVISRADLVKATDKPTQSLDAYDHFLLGLEAKHHWNTNGFLLAVSHFRKAIELDSEFAKAWSFLSLNLSFLALEAPSQSQRQALWKEAKSSAERAFALDPDDPEVLWRVARERVARGDVDNGSAMLRRAVMLAPANADVLMVAAWTSVYVGVRGSEPLKWARRAHELTPIRPAKYTISLGMAAFSARDYALCVATLRSAPETLEVLAFLAIAEALEGELAAARQTAGKLLAMRPDFRVEDLFGPSGFLNLTNVEDIAKGASLAQIPTN